MNLYKIAEALHLKRTRDGFQGVCPSCDYPTGFSLNEKAGKLLAYCHTGHCSWEAILRELQIRRLLPITESYRAAIVATPATVRPRETFGCYSVCDSRYSKVSSDFIQKLWDKSLPVQGSLAENYLKSRGITIPIAETIRFLPSALHKPSGLYLPVMLARVDYYGHPQMVGLHRTFLNPDGTGKADVISNKMMLGAVTGGSVHLTESTDTLAVTEGIETGLSVQEATGIPTWVALTCNGLKTLVLPSGIKQVYIFADHDNALLEKDPGLKAAAIVVLISENGHF